jgi:uncharacterized membrane protein
MTARDSQNMAGAGQKQQIQERRMELLVGYLLLVGVIASSTILVSGIVWDVLRHGHMQLEYLITGMNFFQFLFADLRALVSGSDFGPRTFVNMGIALLLLTPFIRVLASMVFFAVEERSVKYTLFTLFVAVVLAYSLFLR